MDSKDALNQARVYAANKYAAAFHTASLNLPRIIGAARNIAAAKGRLMSGSMIRELAEIHGKYINDLVNAKLDGLLEGCELHNVTVDEPLATDFLIEVVNVRNNLFADAVKAVEALPGGNPALQAFPQELEASIPFATHAIRVEIDRRRLMAKKRTATTVYHLHDNSRVNIGSTDNSVNIVSTSSEQVFADLRQILTTNLPSGEEQKLILEKLGAMEQAHNSPSLWQRYSEFISVCANHMELVAPFIPALTEILHRVLK